MLVIRPFIHHAGRECLGRAFFGPVNHNDHKHQKVAEKDSSTFSENTLIPEPTARSAVPDVSPGQGLLIWY